MGKRKGNPWADWMMIGAMAAAAVYCVARIRDASVPDAPVVVESVEQPKKAEVKPIVPQQKKLEVEQDVSQPKSLEQIVIDKKTGLVVVQPRDSIQFYGARVLQGGSYRSVDKDLYDLLTKMADAYKVEFKKPLLVGPMWDTEGHKKGSKHYSGLAVDIDFGANLGTAEYTKADENNKTDRARAEFLLQFIQKYEKEHNKGFNALFNDPGFVEKNLCKSYPGHDNHIHIGK